MNRRIRSIALLLPSVMLLAATCVSETRQRGPAGPWVGEVVNYGTDPAPGVYVTADVFDATGAPMGQHYVFTCPGTIPAGGRGTFKLFAPGDPGITLPLRAKFAPIVVQGGSRGETGEGLITRLVSANPAKRAAIVEVRNESAKTLGFMEVCGNLRGASGDLLEVGSAQLFPTVLRPGESQTLPIFFNSMPPGDFEFFAQGYCCSSSVVLDPSEFQVSSSRITTGPAGRSLVVAGEVRNRSGQDLSMLRLITYVEGAPETRVTAVLGCDGMVGYGEIAAATFAIPLDPGQNQPKLVIIGTEGLPFSNRYSVPVSNVKMAPLPDQPDGLGTVAVGATLRNPTSKWLSVERECATVRDRDGKPIGVVPLLAPIEGGYGYQPLIAPGASVDVVGAGYVVGTPAGADVRAYAEPREQGPIFSPPSP